MRRNVQENQEHIEAIAEYRRAKEEKISLSRLNAIVQDGLTFLDPFLFTLDLLAPQLPSYPEVDSARQLLQSWKTLIQIELFFGSGEESTARRRNLQTKAGMTSAGESVTEILRRLQSERESLLRLVQEAERNRSTLIQSIGREYKRHLSSLSRRRNLLSVKQRHDVMDKVVLGFAFLWFIIAVLFIVSKRIERLLWP